MPELPETVPLFPLSNVVLFPGTTAPLHVFEPRYRQLLRDVLDGEDRLIGMILLAPGWEADYEGEPPLLATGCAGRVMTHVPLSDGRSNIELRGVGRFDVQEELPSHPYRIARVRWRPEPPDPRDDPRAAGLLAIATQLTAALGERGLISHPGDTGLGSMVSELALEARLDAEDRQALLEIDDPGERADRLTATLRRRLEALRRMERSRRFAPEDPGVN